MHTRVVMLSPPSSMVNWMPVESCCSCGDDWNGEHGYDILLRREAAVEIGEPASCDLEDTKSIRGGDFQVATKPQV